jgi:hypothetical protein
MKKVLLIALVLFGLLPASIAAAHDPIILTSEQQTPADGPLLVDGTVSFALYGSLEAADDTRGFRVNFNAGDPLYISILIPDLAPENMLDDASLPFVNVKDPNGTTVKLAITQKVSFPEPYTGTNYVRLTEFRGTAIGGVYLITVTGKSAARFTVSVGEKEMFGTTVENIPNRDLGVAGVMAWYAGDLVAIEETVESVVETPSSETSSSNQSTPLIVMITVIVVILVIVGLGFARVIKIRQRKTTQ